MMMMKMVLVGTKARLGESDWESRESEGGSRGGYGGGGPNWAVFHSFTPPLTRGSNFGQNIIDEK